MKKNFLLTSLALLIVILNPFCTVTAIYDEYIIQTNGDPNTAIIRTTKNTGKTFNDIYYTASNDAVAEKNQYYRIKMNGKDAFCIEHDKRYGLQNLYRQESAMTNNSIKKIYKYGTSDNNDNNFFSQLLIWYLGDQGYGWGSWSSNVDYLKQIYTNETQLKGFSYYYYFATSNNINLNLFKENAKCDEIGNGELQQLCNDIKNKSILEKINRYVTFLNRYFSNDINNTRDTVDRVLRNIQRLDVTGLNLSVYIPENPDINQKVIAPRPDDLNETCTSVYKALMLKYSGNIPDSELEKLKKFPEYVPETKSCRNADDECWQAVYEVRQYTAPKHYPNRKAGVGYAASHTGSYKVKVGDIYVCGDTCDTLLSDLKAGKDIKYNSCNDLYSKVANVTKNSCKEASGKITSFECEPPDGGKKTCNDLLPTAKAQGWSCKQLKDSITDSYLVECDSATNKPISCQPTCEPKITVHEKEATCKSKGKSETFALSDSTKLSNTVDPETKQECVSKDVGYNQKGDIVGSKDTVLSNSYCDVYCWESLSVILPTDPQVVSSSYEKGSGIPGAAKAGRLFFWGLDYSQGIFSQMNVKRICWTKPNYDKFNQEWNANETNIRNTYDEYTKYVAFRDSNNVQTDNRCILREGAQETFDVRRGDAPASGCTCNDSNPISQDDMCHCTRPGNPTYGTRYSRDVNGIHGETECYETAQSNPDELLDHLYDKKIDELRSAINGFIDERNNKYNAINSCQEKKSKDQLYRAKPVTNLQRSVYDIRKVQLETGKLQEISNTSSETTATRNYGCTVIGPEFGVGPCKNNAISIKDFSNAGEYEWNFEGQYNFYYTKDFHHWIIQPEGSIIQQETKEYKTREEEIKVLDDKGLAYDIGIGFYTKMTTGWGFLHIKVNMANLGTCIDDKCTKFHFDSITNGTKTILDLDKVKERNEKEAKTDDDLTYDCAVPLVNQIYESECTYYIDNNGEMKPASSKLPQHCPKAQNPDKSTIGDCPNCDLDIVYRLIDMGAGNEEDIFPGKDGKGREIGTNWESLIKNGKEKFNYITTYNKIYGSKPIYTIELTPATITEIRKDNNNYRRSSNKDPYTSYYDADNKLKISCNNERGANHSCVSSFITKYIQKGVIKGEFAKADQATRIKYIKNYKCYYATGKLDSACSNDNLVY